MKRQPWRRGDIVALDFDPTLGHEQQGRRPAIVVTPDAFNRLGMVGVCPITQGGQAARNIGMAVVLDGMQTAGVVLIHQFRMIDPAPRRLSLIERASDQITEEVRARVAALLE